LCPDFVDKFVHDEAETETDFVEFSVCCCVTKLFGELVAVFE
jgi:hypothetical protein